jgi:hypothetical protein
MIVVFLAISILAKTKENHSLKRSTNVSKKFLLDEGDPEDIDGCYDAFLALVNLYDPDDTDGTPTASRPPVPTATPVPPPTATPLPPPTATPDPGVRRTKYEVGKSLKNILGKSKSNLKVEPPTPAELLATFEEKCAATAATTNCAALIVKLKSTDAPANDAEKKTFPTVCAVENPNPDGAGSNGFISSKASKLIMLLGLAYANFYF